MASIHDDTCPEEDGDELLRRLYNEQQELRLKKREAEFQMEMNGVRTELEMKRREVDELKQQIVDIRARLDDRAAVQQLWDDPVRVHPNLAADDQAAREERASTRRYLVTQATGIATYRHHLQRIREAGTSYLEGGTHPPSGSKEAFFKAVDQMLTQYYLIDPGTSTASKSTSFHF